MKNQKASFLVNTESNKLWRMKSNALKEGLLSYSGSHLANYTIEGNASETLAMRLNISDEKQRRELNDFFRRRTRREVPSTVSHIARLRDAYGHAYEAMEGHYNRADAAAELTDAIKDVLYDRAENEMARLQGMLSENNISSNLWKANGTPDKASKVLIDDAINAYTSTMINNVQLTPGYRKNRKRLITLRTQKTENPRRHAGRRIDGDGM